VHCTSEVCVGRPITRNDGKPEGPLSSSRIIDGTKFARFWVFWLFWAFFLRSSAWVVTRDYDTRTSASKKFQAQPKKKKNLFPENPRCSAPVASGANKRTRGPRNHSIGSRAVGGPIAGGRFQDGRSIIGRPKPMSKRFALSRAGRLCRAGSDCAVVAPVRARKTR